MADALHAGAQALQDLMRRLSDKGDDDLAAAYARVGEVAAGDARDYPAMVDMVQRDLAANLDHPSLDHRQGYLRALTDLLCTVGDGAAPSVDSWDPIRTTAASFARQAATQDMARCR